MRGRLWLLPLLLTAAVLGVAGCGGDDDESATPAGGDISPAELVPLEFQLSWLPGGDNLEFWAGVEKGFFRDEGLDVTIRSSNDPTQSIKLAASGERKLAIAYTGDVITSAAKGSPVTAVFALTEGSPFGIIALGKAGIDSAEDLEGKRVGVTSLPIDQAFFDVMLAEAGLTRKDVKVVDPGFGGIQQVIQGNLDATSAIDDYEPAVLESKNIDDYTFLYYRDYGAPDAPFYAIVANPEWLAGNGDVVRRFLSATRRSIEWTKANTEEAAAIFKRRFPDQDENLAAEIWRREAEIQGTGELKEDEWQTLADFLFQRKLIDQKVAANELVTNDYLPEG